MLGWTTSDVKKIENLMKTFRSETLFSYLQLLYIYIYIYTQREKETQLPFQLLSNPLHH